MSKILDKPVRVLANPDGVPASFFYRRHQRVREILDQWVEIGEWWEGDCEKRSFRVKTEAGGVYELYRQASDGEWRLYKIYD
jgi:hypothetical protein